MFHTVYGTIKTSNCAWACFYGTIKDLKSCMGMPKKIHPRLCSGNLAMHTRATKIAGGARHGRRHYITCTHTSKNNISMVQNTQGHNKLAETNFRFSWSVLPLRNKYNRRTKLIGIFPFVEKIYLFLESDYNIFCK